MALKHELGLLRRRIQPEPQRHDSTRPLPHVGNHLAPKVDTSEHRMRANDHTTALAEHSGMTSFSVRSTESASTQR